MCVSAETQKLHSRNDREEREKAEEFFSGTSFVGLLVRDRELVAECLLLLLLPSNSGHLSEFFVGPAFSDLVCVSSIWS